MKRPMGHLVLGTLMLIAEQSVGGLRAQDKDKSPETNQLAPLSRFVGEWTVEGKWSSGDELRARNVYEWRLGNKIIKSKTFVKTDKGEYQRYDAVMAWHPKRKQLFIISFAYDGGMTENVIEPKADDTILIGFVPFQEGEPSKVRQTIQFKDNDHFTWRVELQSDSGWQELINATWVRKSK
ncbi:MAG TPA: hypothetical protein VGX70_03995 [Gemmataceae bacterium]|nr:hypothetical protein [Gemmataceae bacterium]